MTAKKSISELVRMIDAARVWVLNTPEHGTLRYALLTAASYRGEGIPGCRIVTADGALAIDEEQLIELLRVTGLVSRHINYET